VTDEELIASVLEGQRGARGEFVRRYEALVLDLARRRFGFRGEAADELLQQVVEKLWDNDCRALRSWRGGGPFSSYLTVIVCHACLRQRGREHQQQRGRVQDGLALEQVAAPGPLASERLARREKRETLRAALKTLSPRDRLLLVLRFGDERTPKEISTALGLRPGTARKALHDALRRLKGRARALNPELFSSEPPGSADQGPLLRGGKKP